MSTANKLVEVLNNLKAIDLEVKIQDKGEWISVTIQGAGVFDSFECESLEQLIRMLNRCVWNYSPL